MNSDVFIALGQILINSLQEFSKGLSSGSLRKDANPDWTELLDSAATSNILLQISSNRRNYEPCLFK